MKNLIGLFILFAPVLSFAQSVGGGGGGDRPGMAIPVSAQQMKVPPLMRVDPSQLTCAQFADIVNEFGKVRIDLRGKQVSYFMVLQSSSRINCIMSTDRTLFPVRTLDRKSCAVGYYCRDNTIR